MQDWVKNAKAGARKTVTAPSGRSYVICKLTSSELTEASISPIISDGKPQPEKNEVQALIWFASNIDKVQVARQRATITEGVVSPRIFYGEESSVADGEDAVHARWVAEDEEFLYLSVLEFSGLTNEKERARLGALIKNESSSASSTPSQGVTDDASKNLRTSAPTS